MAGAPCANVDYGMLAALLESNVSKTDIAYQLGISRPTLNKIITEYGLGYHCQW